MPVFTRLCLTLESLFIALRLMGRVTPACGGWQRRTQRPVQVTPREANQRINASRKAFWAVKIVFESVLAPLRQLRCLLEDLKKLSCGAIP